MACRSSGVLTTSSVVHNGQCKLISIHGQHTGADTNAAMTIKVFDNTAASGTELARFILGGTAPTAPITIEFDMHGALATTGLYLEISGTGTAAISVEFN